MLIKPFVDENLGNSSYLVASEETRQAVVIDAERDIDQYVRVAKGLGLRLTHALDTHLHADFVSGARELAAQYEITIGASAEANLAFDHLPLAESNTLSLGDLTLTVLATPGHTPEHIAFALVEEKQAEPTAIFTGGALIVGGAARPDLLGHHFTRPLTKLLYETIHQKLLRFPDPVAIYPTHGAGSFCNAPSSPERVTTIGNERRSNPLAQAESLEEFAELALGNLPTYPKYFGYLRAVNQLGARILGGFPALPPLSPQAVREQMAQGVAVVDTRSPRKFAAGHIPDAFGIPVDTPLGSWAGWVIPFNTPIILIGDNPTQRDDAVRQLIRIGYDDLRGYLDGGLAAWQSEGLPIRRVPMLSAEEFHLARERGETATVLDVRQAAEWQSGHLPRAIHVEGGRLPWASLPWSKQDPILVHCGHGARSTVGISILERRGFSNLRELDGGFSAYEEAGLPVVRDE